MNNTKSEFHKIDTGGDGHTCAFEYVPSAKRARAIYLVFDGKRIAHRGDPDGSHQGEWVSMVPGVEVVDEADGRLSIYFEDRRLH
jgi:hypothetical protein